MVSCLCGAVKPRPCSPSPARTVAHAPAPSCLMIMRSWSHTCTRGKCLLLGVCYVKLRTVVCCARRQAALGHLQAVLLRPVVADCLKACA